MSLSLIKKQYKENKIGWQNSHDQNFCQDNYGNALPWMTYPFINFISTKLKPDHKIFEFGSGSSTIFFAKRVAKVVTLESRKEWFEKTQNKIYDNNIKNVELFLMEDALTNEDYENFPLTTKTKFDLIIIDSLKRFNCAKNCLNSLEKGGTIILDDSERKNYKKIFDFFQSMNFDKIDFYGISPGQLRIKNTTIFYKT